MDIMNDDWLLPTVEKDLNAALESASGPDTEVKYNKYEDDGSNLRVNASKLGIVQITKWESQKEPFTVTVSDSFTYMKATISSSAATEHRRRTRKRIIDGTLGNIIQLLQVEIVATHLGPRPARIKLLVGDFKVIGSDRSAAFGSPRPFEATLNGQQLLEKLTSLRKSNETLSHASNAIKAPDGNASTVSRADDLPTVGDSRLSSEQLFSQVPTTSALGNTSALVAKKRLTGLRLPQSADTLHNLGGDGKPMNRAGKLLEMLKARNAPSCVADSAVAYSEEPVSPQDSIPKPAPSPMKSTGAQASPLRVAEVHSTAPPPSDIHVPKSDTRPTSPLKRKDSSSNIKGEGIRLKDVKISRDQQKLFEDSRAWLPVGSGRRGPIANVPVSVLQDITHRVEQIRAEAVATEVPEWTEQASIPNDPKGVESIDDVDTEDESMVPSMDWPPSSPILAQRELPPDSSMENLAHSDSDEEMPFPRPNSPTVDDNIDMSDVHTLVESPKGPAASPTHQEDVRSVHDLSLPGGRSPRDGDNDSPLSGAVHPAIANAGTTSKAVSTQQARATHLESESVDSDYELETTVPLRLDQATVDVRDHDSTREVPSTAYEQEPVLQVKRTPYEGAGLSGHRQQRQIPQSSGSDIYSSPSKKRRIDSRGTPQLIGLKTLDDSPQALGLPPTHGSISSKSSWDASQKNNSGVEETFLAAAYPQKASPTLTTMADSHSTTRISDGGQDSQVHKIEAFQGSQPLSNPSEIHNAQPPLLSPHVTKRRKAYRSPIIFKFSQEEYPKEDPSIAAIRQRAEFFASRRSSRSTPFTDTHNLSLASLGNPADKNFQVVTLTREGSVSSGKCAYTREASHPIRHQSTIPRSGQGSPGNEPKHQIHKIEDIGSPTEDNFSGSPHRDAGRTGMVPSAAQTSVMASVERSDLLLAQSVSSQLHSVSTKLEGISSTQHTNNSGELMTPALSVIDMPQDLRTSPSLGVIPQATSPRASIFARFRAMYPDYLGTKEHFVGMCKRIHQLCQADRMEHKSLWDDFIIRHKIDYQLYTQHCINNAEDGKTYERFYRDEIDEPRYIKRIVQPATLAQVLPPVKVESPDTHVGARSKLSSTSPRKSSPASKFQHSTPSRPKPLPTSTGKATNSHSSQFPPSIQGVSPTGSKQSGGHSEKFNSERVIIDLTDDRDPSRSPSPLLGAQPSSVRLSQQTTSRPDQHNASGSPDLRGGQARVQVGTTRRKGKLASRNTARPKEQGVEVDEWWKDDNTPFREFTRLYHSIRPGKGNAWAAEKDKAIDTGKQAEIWSEDISNIVLADVMNWRL